MKYDNVIVFGPSGGVGSAAALYAHSLGAKVWLAMRDTTKAISGLTPEQEHQSPGAFTRIQADLSDASSVANAVRQSGAKAAFTYASRDASAMQLAAKAMKDAGLEYVVLLSSSALQQISDLRAVERADFIPFMHAQAELAIEDAGLALTAVRPGYFASNPVNNELDRSQSPARVRLFRADHNLFDPVDPEDIGRVCGSVLVSRPSQGQKELVYVQGPEIMSNSDLWKTVLDVTGENIDIQNVNKEEYVQMMAKKMPMPVAQYLAGLQEQDGERHDMALYEETRGNVKKYTGREPALFADYVARHKEDFEPLKK
ncbi:hypothetical protein RBB50_003904 [Rhinocladiella similis]